MARLNVIYGAPRREIVYPAAPENLSKLLGVDLSGLFAFMPDALQAHELAATPRGAADLTAGPLATAMFDLAATFAAVSEVVPSLEQLHAHGAVFEAGFATSAGLEQAHLAGPIDIFAGTTATFNMTVGNDLAAVMNVASDLAGDVDASPAGNPMQAAKVSYTGSGASQSITGVGFRPDMVIVYDVNGGAGDKVFIGDRIALGTGRLWPADEDDDSWLDWIINDSNSFTSYDADGFTLGSSNRVNASGVSYVAACFKMGDQFDIIDKANDGTSGQVVAHSLAAAPVWAFCKQAQDSAGSWVAPWTEGGEAADTFGGAKSANTEGLQARSSSDVTLGNDAHWNPSGAGNAALYLFGDQNALGAFHTGTYTGDGSAGNAVTGLGFQPSLVLVRAIDGAGVFLLDDNLFPDTAYKIDGPARDAAFTLDADGFTVDAGDVNRSGESYRYFAWA